MTMMLVPAKRLRTAKSRLSQALAADARHALSSAMLRHVLVAARNCDALRSTYVVSVCHEVAHIAQQEGAQCIEEPAGIAGNLQTVVDYGIATARHSMTESVIVVMGDLPCLQVQDLDALVDALRSHDVVLAPDRHTLGTNALGLASHISLPTCFGRSDSYHAHVQQCRDLGLSAATIQRHGLALDIDTEADLNDYLATRESPEVVSSR